MNIWILNHYAIPPELGPLIRHYKFAEKLIERGYDVKIIAASTVHNSDVNMINDSSKYLLKKYNGVPFIFLRTTDYAGNGKKRILNMFTYAIGLVTTIRKMDVERPDVIYASSAHPLTWLAGYRLAKKYKAKFIAETRDLWPETLVSMGRIDKNSIPAKILYALEKFIYKRADKLLFTFPGGKDYVKSRGLDETKCRYINNGIDLEEFNDNIQSNKYHDEMLENRDSFKVLYTGSMGLANSLHYLVEAAKIIQDKGMYDICFLLYGDGYEKEQLEQYVKNNNLTNVIFRGKVEKKYIPSILSKSDLNAFTGQHINLYKYGLSLNKMFDYFASGKPTISNLECGYDMLEKYKCGKTVNGGSAEALAEGIIQYYNMSKDEYDAYCMSAKKAAQDFDFNILTDMLEKIIIESK